MICFLRDATKKRRPLLQRDIVILEFMVNKYDDVDDDNNDGEDESEAEKRREMRTDYEAVFCLFKRLTDIFLFKPHTSEEKES